VEVRLAKFDLKEYARRGAEARVSELMAELSEIYRSFPGLRLRGKRAASAAAPARRRRRRKPMTAAQKKAVSVRMKKYWAGRRKASE
jgi:hypothetical protein